MQFFIVSWDNNYHKILTEIVNQPHNHFYYIFSREIPTEVLSIVEKWYLHKLLLFSHCENNKRLWCIAEYLIFRKIKENVIENSMFHDINLHLRSQNIDFFNHHLSIFCSVWFLAHLLKLVYSYIFSFLS